MNVCDSLSKDQLINAIKEELVKINNHNFKKSDAYELRSLILSYLERFDVDHNKLSLANKVNSKLQKQINFLCTKYNLDIYDVEYQMLMNGIDKVKIEK